MRVHLLFVAAFCCFLSSVSTADACTCMPPDEGRSYADADHVVHARIVRPLLRTSTTRSYVAQLVEDDYKGCLSAGQRVIVETAANDAACGFPLRAGEEYLLHGDRRRSVFGTPVLRVGLCDANVRWAALTPEHRAFLDSRYVCCGGECSCTDGSPPVNCLVDPCQVSSCDVEGAVCSSNYCGGCNAEWYDPTGARVCEAPAAACDYDAPGREYIARDPATCATIRFACAAGLEPFFDECGCGCADSAATTCKVGGCSGQLCIEPGDPGTTTCEWREEYACYRDATCTRQSNGSCGWTPTPELRACLAGAQ